MVARRSLALMKSVGASLRDLQTDLGSARCLQESRTGNDEEVCFFLLTINHLTSACFRGLYTEPGRT